MKAIFVESSVCERYRAQHLSDEDYRAMQEWLLVNPEIGPVIQGTGGLRKLRWSTPRRGKRGGCRVIYYWLVDQYRFYMATMYSKGGVADLTPADKRVLKQMMEAWKHEQA